MLSIYEERGRFAEKNGFRNLITESRFYLLSVLEYQVVLLSLTVKFITQKQVTNW